MSNYNVVVMPYELIEKSTIIYVDITNVKVTLNTSASCVITLMDIDKNVKKTLVGGLSQEQYQLWGENDEYFVNTVLENIGLTPASVTLISNNSVLTTNLPSNLL